ncbi:phage tail spike protein [Streptococcus infantis]|uniref:phage tail spike protein n=1 Tax=Streptococcus infantis TaxID=68892 RepID=UPI0039C2BDE5
MLYLLNKDVRTVQWNGEPLHEATSAIVKETMNGDFTLTLKYPISDSGIYQLIQEDMLIKAPTPVLGAQLFRIKKPVENNDHLEITAYHISDDVMQRSITPVSVTSQSCGMVLSRMVQNTKTALGDFSFNSDIQDRRTFNTTETETLYSVLLDGKHSIVGTWEGELVRDNFAMTVKKSRGENRGVVITTHKNLKDYQRTKNSQNVITRIHAKSTFKPEGAEKETTIRVTVDSPLINSYPYINEKEYENNNAKTVEELQKWAQAKFTNQGIDKVSDAIKIEAYELDGQVVNMGDTVNLKSWKHNVDAFKKAIAYEFDALKEEYISLTFDDKAGTGGSRASGGLSSAADAILGVTESAQEIALEKALQNTDLGFDHQAELLRQEIADGIELARAKAEEVKQELSDTIDQRFSSFENGPLQDAKRRAEEALRNAGASSLLAQEAKRIGLDSVAKLEEFKRQATSAQIALSGDLDVLKRTIANDIRPKQAKVETEIAKQVEALVQTKKELAGVKSAQATYEESTTRRLAELANVADGKASKSELVQTADELASRIASVQAGSSRNYFRNSRSRTFTIGDQAIYDYRTFIVPDFWKNGDRFKRDYVRLSFDVTFPVALSSDTQANVHFSAHPWYGYKLTFKGGTTERQHFEFTIDLSGSSETYQTNNVFIRFGTNYGFPAGLQVVIENAMLSVGNYFPAYQPAYEDQEDRVSAVESNFRQRADALDAGVSRLTEGLRTKADISSLNVTAENIRQSVKSLETSTQNKLDQKLSMAEFEVRASSIRQEILNATKDKADKTLVVAEAGKLREEFSGLRIGGRNYYLNSDKLVTRPRFIQFNIYPYLTADNIGQDWTFSFDLKINETGTVRQLHFYHYQRNGLGIGVDTFFNPSKEWKRYSFTGKVVQGGTNPAYAKGAMAIYDHAGDNNISIRNVKFEKGTLATDWSPSIEDTDGLITEAKATFERTAQGLRTDLSAIQEYVNKDGQRQEALQRYTREESAKQATAVRELVNRDFVGKATYQEDVRGIERRFEVITNPKNGTIATQIVNYKQSVDGRFTEITSLISGKANQTDFQRVKETSQLYERILGNTDNGIANNIARMAMTNQLFQVEVSKVFENHRNLFLSSTATKGYLGNAGTIYAANSTQKEITSDFISVEPNENIIFQHWVTLPDNGMAWTAWQFFDKNKNPIDNRKPGLNAYKTTVGKQHNINQITVPTNAYFVRFSARMYDDGLIKVEKGSAPSDYSVAPNDALEAVKTVQRQLDGSWSVQNLTNAGAIVSQINATTNQILIEAEKIRLKGKTLLDELTAIQGYFKRLFVGDASVGTLNSDIIRSNSITADKLVMDIAMARRFVSSDIFTDTLAAKEAFINKLRSVVVTATLLEGYKGRIGGFQIGTHEKDSSVYWITGQNQFSVGMSNGSGQWSQTALWVNWGNNWGYPGDYAWYVKNNGKMYCYNTAEFWNTPVIHGNLRVTGHIYYNNENSGKSGYWIHSSKYSNFEPSNNYLYLYYSGSGYDWIPMNKEISDRRYKHNIEVSTVSGLDVVKNLKTYSYRKEYDGKIEDISCGIMAQDVQKYAPEAFYENPDGAYSYNTFALVPYLIKAIQELNQKIKKLEKTA